MQPLFEGRLIESCHDISEGGLLVALVESCFARGMGLELVLGEMEQSKLHEILFNQSAGRFVVSVHPDRKDEFEKSLDTWHFLGEVTDGGVVGLTVAGKRVLEKDIGELWDAGTGSGREEKYQIFGFGGRRTQLRRESARAFEETGRAPRLSTSTTCWSPLLF